MNVPPILKNKWVLIGGGAIILFALLMGGKSGASSSGGTAQPTDAQVAAQTQLALAQIGAQTQANANNAQFAIAQQQGQIDIAKTQLQFDLSKYAIDAQAANDALQANTSRDIQLAQIASSDRQAMASINAQEQMTKWQLDQATANTQIITDFQMQYAEAANQTNIQLNQIQANLVNNQLIANRDVTLAGLATQEQLASIAAGLQRDVTYSNNQTQQAVYATMSNAQVEQTRIQATNETERARIQAGVEKKKSSNGLIGGIVGGVLGLFSDRSLKSDVIKVGEYNDGLGIYHYRVPWAEGVQHGVMADEVRAIRPHAMGPKIAGFDTVNYRAIGYHG